MKIKVANIENNTGQIDGVPENPRTITKEEYEKIRHKMSDRPESIEEEPLLLYDKGDGHYVALGGNQRLRAIRELGWKEIEHVGRIIPNGEPPQKIMDRILESNLHAGEWDWDLLANEWPEDYLAEWNLIPETWKSEEIKEPKEISDKFKGLFGIIINCKNETEQLSILQHLLEDGYDCRTINAS